MRELLVRQVFPVLGVVEAGEDAAWVGDGLLMTTDSFVVKPLFFPGGDIGKLAVYGTVNDLAMRGARPLALTVGLIVEEGLGLEVLEEVLASLAEAAEECEVPIIGGDTKVVEAGRGDGLYINTAGLGQAVAPHEDLPSLARAQPGDAVLVSGPMGEHGVAVLAAREQLGFAAEVMSDCAPLHEMALVLVGELGTDVHCLHDPTRGGLAAALNEIAQTSAVGLRVYEAALPRQEAVEVACELLGFDSLQVANEGKLVAVVAKRSAEDALALMRADARGSQSALVGEVMLEVAGRAEVLTGLGTRRVLEMPSGELLPRIC